ncbi:MAG: superoxide dismutase [Verrucomicrobia bacterium]|nr:superoxide dismutase [Verrucomicrobiota bacterium]
MMTRRQAIKTTALAATTVATLSHAFAQGRAGSSLQPPAPFTLPPLPYASDALEPHIDAQTMEIHHGRHHKAYVDNLVKAVAEFPDLSRKSIEDLVKELNSVPEKIRTAVRNNGGGHYNHALFWQMMKKDGGGEPKGELAKAMASSFGSFAAFKEAFARAGLGQFGSGWAWLVVQQGKLAIQATPNQDSPITQGAQPLLGVDVWEHAYYLKYQNRRADYINAWWNVVNWDFVADRYAKLKA